MSEQMNLITARTAVLEGPRNLRFKEETLDPAALGEGELLCATIVSAISPGTELAAYTDAPPLRPGVVYPRLVGYCNVARVLACGKTVSGIAPGDRILSFSSHRSHFCLAATDALAVLPEGVVSDDAACAYLFHLGYNAVLKSGLRPGSEVVVIGLGVLGLTTVALAALAGAHVFAISDHESPREKALAFGATACFSRAEFPQLAERLGPARAQVVITTSNTWADWRLALEGAGQRGTIAVLGFPGRQETAIPFNPLDSAHFYMRQLCITAVGMSPELPDSRGFLPFNERANLKRLLDWIEAGRLLPAELVSGRFPGSQLASAYESLLRREGSPLTYLLDWSAGQ
ncbi:zinc-binding alcohol dehydrogenase [uncultured Propionivibrio sp.]|uniref:zinc-dependent alcohol dehydrogenase n=1 Tax=uncultured Propionivibrio sp. TaxID=426737 RepID=UPI0029C02FC7|nr:zinc-binding alcohol dehydrogenase [uncultured Propionivibrio sp.]